MVFILAENEPVLFLMFVESDVLELRRWLTKFVDDRHIGGKTFNRVVCSLHKNKEEIMKLVSSLPGGDKKFVAGGPKEGENVCAGCKGTVAVENLFEGKCIVCWATEAKAGLASKLNIKPV